jgi:hypothetical protein
MLRAVAHKTGYELKIPRWSNGIMGATPVQLAPFNLAARELTGGDQVSHHFHEPEHCFGVFLPQVFEVSPGTSFLGYFQSWKYFADIQDKIREEFSMREPYPEQAQQVADKHRTVGRPLVSIHVRRGDYLTPSNLQAHRIPGPDYYREAYRHFLGATYLIFSDDVSWCRETFRGDQFAFCDTGNHWLDLAIMSRCDHHILAASSFSWWGAWLNPSPNKEVIAPHPWIGPALSHCPTGDLYPDNWIKLAG